MSIAGEQVLLRVYLESADRPPFVPTYERIVKAARKQRLAGATVLQGILGAGYHHLIKASTWSLAQHVPVIVEIVDAAEQIRSFVEDVLPTILTHGMLTLERAAVMLYRGPGDRALKKTTLLPAAPLAPLITLPRFQPSATMKINENGILLRVFIGESDRHGNQTLYEAIVQKVRQLGLAGATVLRGSEGFGAHSVVHKASLLDMSKDLPIVIEIIDTEEKIKTLLPHLDEMVGEGLVTMEYVVVILYRDGAQAPPQNPGL